MKPRFSLAMLLLEVGLIGVVIGLARQAVISLDSSGLAPVFLFGSLLALGAAYGILRLMLGATEPPDFPPPVP